MYKIFRRLKLLTLKASLASILIMVVSLCFGQTTMVKVKTLDKAFTPVPSLGVSINGHPSFFTTSDGVTHAEVPSENLPPKTIVLSDESLEPESWNYSKGVLEIIVRKKTYQVINLFVTDNQGKRLSGLNVVCKTNKTLTALTDGAGKATFALPLNENTQRENLFSIEGYRITSLRFSGRDGTMIIERINQNPAPAVKEAKPTITIKTYGLDNLDSIKSLTMFYAIFKDLDVKKLSQEKQKRIDEKFIELIKMHDDSVNHRLQGTLLGTVTGSSLIKEDIELLTEQALVERQFLLETQQRVNDNIEIVSRKLAQGGSNFSDSERESLLSDLNKLSEILLENERRFIQGQSFYVEALNALRGRLLSIHQLENQLSSSEKQRLAEREAWKRRLLATATTIVVLSIVSLILYLLTMKFIRQKNELTKAHAEVKRMNENLEELVRQRTVSLESVNRELDTFLYRSAHDLRRPLTTIIGLANIAKHTLSPDGIALFEKAASTAKAMDRLLKKLTMVSILNHPSEKQKINFHCHIQDIVEQFQDFLHENQITFKYTVDADVEFSSVDEIIRIILTNLAENAFFFSTLKRRNQPCVEIRVFKTDSHIFIIFHDNGIGIDEDVKSKIGKMFFVGHEQSKGNGLGLYIAHRAAKILNGDIQVKSVENAYTELTVSFPV